MHVGEVVKLRLSETAHTVLHAQNFVDDASGLKTLAKTFNYADKRLVNDGGRSAGLSDGGIAFDEVQHRYRSFTRGDCSVGREQFQRDRASREEFCGV